MIRTATRQGIEHVANNLRDEEIVVKELGRVGARERCIDVASHSHWGWQIEINGVPAAVFGGDGEPGEPECSVWLFCTHLVEEAPIELLKGIRTCVEWGKQHWPELVIEAEARSPSQQRFIHLLGFSVRNTFERDGVLYEELAI